MADTKDMLEARRLFRERLVAIGRQYPHLQQPASQQRLADYLREENALCHENPPDGPEDAQ